MREWAEALVQLVAPERCVACDGSPVQSAFCSPCAVSVERATDVRGVFEYGGPVADAIQRFKYDGRSELSRPLGRLLSAEARRLRGAVDAVVPVPLHWRRRRVRGYDQAALLARPVARSLGVPLWLRRLRRIQATAQQAGLCRRDRLRNVERAFACIALPNAPSVLLIDDVATTGATLAAATRSLRDAGAASVIPLVLAIRPFR